ncbi:Oxidoreductase-like protein, N-terminal [Marinobacterium lutimaris]|uniref:Oxidoreductase-like protein, N-terminal n=1 Tax=Marinobacterium lutimaris TaxID=568106 RepID=A0A1H6CGB9_9GAMM|nr:Oxidoreductase-like protein, N-terminal [Marinobacterium lutimaris]
MLEKPTLEKPTPPMDGECCESECSPCVWDTYYEEMNAWRQAEAERKAAEAAAGDNAGQQS